MHSISNINSHERPLITVITPSYNSEYLLESVSSLLCQTYERLQYIIIDDGSTHFDEPGTIKFIEENRSDNLVDYTIIQNKINLGTVKTMNRGLMAAAGKYIFNLAADDVFYDERVLEEWVKEFEKRNARVLMGARAIYDITLTKFVEMLPGEKDIKLLNSGNSQEIFARLVKSNIIFGACTARSKTLVESFGLYDEEFILLEDYPMALMLCRKGVPIEYWDRPVVKYRLGGTSSPEKFNPKYEKDSNLVLTKEILPYAKHPLLAKMVYYKWKIMQKEHGKFSRSYRQLKSSRRFYAIPFLGLRYPIPTLVGLKNRLKNILKKRSK